MANEECPSLSWTTLGFVYSGFNWSELRYLAECIWSIQDGSFLLMAGVKGICMMRGYDHGFGVE